MSSPLLCFAVVAAPVAGLSCQRFSIALAAGDVGGGGGGGGG